MGPQYFWWSGMWIFPIIGIFCMMLFAFMFFVRGHSRNMDCWFGHSQDRQFCENNVSQAAIDILNKRYANGEITKDEFKEMKKEISS